MAVDLTPLYYVLPAITQGDTYPGIQFQYPGDGVLARARIKFADSDGVSALELDSDSSGMTLTTTTDGGWDWQLDEISAATTGGIAAGCYNYDLEVTNAAGFVQTLLRGTWNVLPQITN